MQPSNGSGWTIVDADAHVTEPPDIWTSRVPKKYADVIPRVELNPKTNHHHWKVGDRWYWPVAGASTSQAGWPEYIPSGPWEYEDADPAVYKADERLKRLDEYGVDIQILYPNLVGFISAALIPLGLEVSTMIVRAYNDFMLEWSSADSRRLIPMAMLPFWDLDSAVAELERCVGLGFKGVLFANKFERLGLPSFVDSHWDPIYAAAQEIGIPINYHVGFASLEERMAEDGGGMGFQRRNASADDRRNASRNGAVMIMGADDLLGQILVSGLCERFPTLKLVSVETGFGHIPFYLEALDWHWKTYGNHNALPLCPSEYFKRQCYGTYWFEKAQLRDLDLYPDNFMFSTDFPHGTSVAPGPCGGTQLTPREYAAEGHAQLDPVLREKALFRNAVEIYNLDVSDREGEAAMSAS